MTCADPSALLPYRDAGYHLIPLCAWDDLGVPEKHRGKAPITRWRSNDYAFDAMWAHAHQLGNVGVRLAPSDLVLDVDPRNYQGGIDSLQSMIADLRMGDYLTQCPCVETGSGGWHFYMKKQPDVPIVGQLTDYPGLDFKSTGFQVVAAGSRHYQGGRYSWIASDLSQPPMVPETLLHLIKRPPLRPFELEGAGDVEPHDLGLFLRQLPVDEYRNEADWRELMMSCHHATGGTGRYEFIAWCMTDPIFDQQGWSPWQIGSRWDSLHRDGQQGENIITKSTLYDALFKHGGKPPEEFADRVFAGYVMEQGAAEAPAAPPAEDLLTRVLNKMNARYAATWEGGKFFVYMLQADPELTQPGTEGEPDYTRDRWVRMKRQDFIHGIENEFVEISKFDKDGNASSAMIPKAQWWLTHPKRRSYEGVWFHPGRELEGWLNMWTGFAYKPIKGSWGELKQLLFEVLCDGCWASTEYVLNWSAHLVQYPEDPAEVALVFQGGKGVGKGTYLRALRKLCGRHGVQVSSPKHLVGNFNAHLRDAIFVGADEAFMAYDKFAEASLKMLITEDRLPYEFKGIDVNFGANRISLCMASNSEWVVPASFGERRFAVFHANLKAQGDMARWVRINQELDNGGYEAMIYELSTRDIRGWHPRTSIPQTPALTRQIMHTLLPVELWWFDVLEKGYLPGSDAAWGSGKVWAWGSHLFDDLTDYTKVQLGQRSLRSVATRMGDTLKRLVPGLTKMRRQVDDSMVRGDSQGRAQGYWFPPLQVCRLEFERLVGASIEW